MTDMQSSDLKVIGAKLRSSRLKRGIDSLGKLADQLAKAGYSRPSIAKLSRIEAGIQPVAADILPGLSELTGIPKSELRPDLVALLREDRIHSDRNHSSCLKGI